VDSWSGRPSNGGDHGAWTRGDRNGFRGGGDPGAWNGGDRHDGDRHYAGGGDHRGSWDHRGPPPGDHPRWTPGRYPHSFRSAHRWRVGPYYAPVGFYDHLWGWGDYLPPSWYGEQYIVADWWNYDLPAPPYGYFWVRVAGDAMLVDQYSGQIAQVIRAVFW
jgi:Ni/Co efflux regulator RcnB